jgi:hypothetical protein
MTLLHLRWIDLTTLKSDKTDFTFVCGSSTQKHSLRVSQPAVGSTVKSASNKPTLPIHDAQIVHATQVPSHESCQNIAGDAGTALAYICAGVARPIIVWPPC